MMPPNSRPRSSQASQCYEGLAGANSQASHPLKVEHAETPSSGSAVARGRPVDSGRIVKAGRMALLDLLKAGEDRVVYRDQRLQVLRPGDDGYWANSG